MKITDVKATAIKGFGGDWIIVRVFTDEGIVGYGETFPTWAGQGPALKLLIEWMKTLLVGLDPTNVDAVVLKLYQRQMYRGISTAGLLTTAISGIEIALWDIASKALNAPLYKLLGGKHRDKIRVYCDFHGGEQDDPVAFAERAREVVEKKFTAIKMDVDLASWRGTQEYHHPLTPAELHRIVTLVAAVRQAIGPEIELALDCHSAFDLPAAIALARALEPFELLWLEEPVPPRNMEALATVASSARTPICVGENLFTRYEFRELFEKRAAQIIMPDIQKTGGILESKRIADLAGLYYVPFAPHCVVSPIGTMGSVHLCASVSNFLILEYHMIDVPWWQELAQTDAPLVQDGYIQVPETPGLGITLDEKKIRRYLLEGETW
jgi:L-alanine-DL-glutamate epimerase-like enolase superfamily enzyme